MTLDKDFGEFAVVRGNRHGGLIRLSGIGASQQGEIVLRILAAHGPELEAGAIITAEPTRLRIRPA